MPDAIAPLADTIAASLDLTTVLALGWLLYLIVLGGWIVLQKREPVATLSWLLGLALLPYVGFLIYHVFGPQKIKRHRLRRANSRSQLDASHDAFGGHADARELARLGQAASGLAPSVAREVRLLVDGGEKYEALLDDIRAARKHVHLEYYIYHCDEIGTALCEALTERARAGVRVRLLVDAVGAARARRMFPSLLDAGGEIAWFHPARFGRIWQRPWINLRTHRKIVVIDGRIAYTGGINISDEQDNRSRDDAFRDLHVRLEGDVVRPLQRVFTEDWIYASGQRDCLKEIADQTPHAQPPGDIAAQVVVSGPDSDWEAIHRVQVGAIHAARRRVWLATPYFVPGEAARMALTSAALAGLDVRVLLPKRSDSVLVTHAARSYFDELIAAGVHIHEYGPRMLHTKALLVDDAISIFGSANFDHRSFRLNFEVAVMFDDRDVAARLDRHLQGEFADAPEVEPVASRPLFTYRLPEAMARLLSPLL